MILAEPGERCAFALHVGMDILRPHLTAAQDVEFGIAAEIPGLVAGRELLLDALAVRTIAEGGGRTVARNPRWPVLAVVVDRAQHTVHLVALGIAIGIVGDE